MILHMLCLLVVLMMVNTVIGAPGQDCVAREDNNSSSSQQPSSSGTLDPLGGGNLVRAADPEAEERVFRSSEPIVDNQEGVVAREANRSRHPDPPSGTLDSLGGGNFVRVADHEEGVYRLNEPLVDNQDGIAREDNRSSPQQPSSSGTLDPLGGDNLLRVTDPEIEVLVFRSSEPIVANQESVAREANRSRHPDPPSGTLDSLGGGNFVRVADHEEGVYRSNEPLVDNQGMLAREENKSASRPSSSGTLDPLGGGNLVRAIDPDSVVGLFRSMELLLDNQESVAREANRSRHPDPPSGTLDSLGGGNFVRVADPEEGVYRSNELFVDNQGMLAREENKSAPRPSSSGTLDPLGGGNLVRAFDPDSVVGIFRSMELLFDNQEDVAREANRSRHPDPPSGTLDSLGGGNFVRVTDPEEGVYRSNQPLVDNQGMLARDENTTAPRPSSSGTLDPLGGGNLVRAIDPDAVVGLFRSMKLLLDNQGRQNMMRLARGDKSTQISSQALDSLGGGHLTGLVGPYRAQIYRSLDRNLDQSGDVLRMLDSMSGTDLLSSLDSGERMAVLSALRKTHTKYPKRMLDSVSGWAFGESKRNFDEIDNVGFTGFAKRSPWSARQSLALAKKNFDEIDRAGFETYNKRDFDEIDRTGFETFEKRDRKE